jgi:hypothetical protein
MTQFEMTTSTEAFGEWNLLDVPFEEGDVRGAGPRPCSFRPGQHLVGHVQAIGEAGRADALSRKADVNAAAGA